MAEEYVAVVDAGTSLIRCFLFSRDGMLLTQRSAPWTYVEDAEAGPLARELDTAAVWRDVCRLLSGAVRSASGSQVRVAAVAVTSQRQGVAFLDGHGREVYAGPNLDLRAVMEGAAIDDANSDLVYRTTGHTPSFLFTAAKLQWFRAQRPDSYARIATVLPLANWLGYKLTGELHGEASLAADAGMLDVESRRWCSDLMRTLGLPDNSHTPLLQAGERLGVVGASVGADAGLGGGTPVAVAGADTQCGLLGLGLAQAGQVGVVAGWSAPLQMLTAGPRHSARMSTWVGCYLTPGAWVLESTSGDTGNSYRWLADTLWRGEPDAFSRMEMEARAEPAGSNGVTVMLGHSAMDMERVGMRRGGIHFPVPLTMNAVTRGQIARAALESAAYAVKANLEQAESVAGSVADTVAVGGGMVQTRLWVDILANVLGRAVVVPPRPQATPTGAYLCAATALGDFGSLEEAAAFAAEDLEMVEPDDLDTADYMGHYERWVEVREQTEAIEL